MSLSDKSRVNVTLAVAVGLGGALIAGTWRAADAYYGLRSEMDARIKLQQRETMDAVSSRLSSYVTREDWKDSNARLERKLDSYFWDLKAAIQRRR